MHLNLLLTSTNVLKIDHLESIEKNRGRKQTKISAFELQFPPFGMHTEEKSFLGGLCIFWRRIGGRGAILGGRKM